jgi:hypothetical protein
MKEAGMDLSQPINKQLNVIYVIKRLPGTMPLLDISGFTQGKSRTTVCTAKLVFCTLQDIRDIWILNMELGNIVPFSNKATGTSVNLIQCQGTHWNLTTGKHLSLALAAATTTTTTGESSENAVSAQGISLN